MNKYSLFLLFLLGYIYCNDLKAQTPVLRYAFNQMGASDSIFDETGNGYNAKLVGSAKIKRYGEFGLLSIGTESGYVDMTARVGNIIKDLTNFTISTYIYVDPAVNLSNNGNFLWTFSNSSDISANPIGCMFYTAKDSRYAISPTNYLAEKTVSIAAPTEQGKWKHIAYMQKGTTGYIFIDGVLTKFGAIATSPKTLGATSYNYLCKSPYSSDALLLHSMLYDFRIYNTSITSTQIAELATQRAALDSITYSELVDEEIQDLSLGDLSAITGNLALPSSGKNSTVITWSSSNESVLSNAGLVTRPRYGEPNANIVLTATITLGTISKNKVFNATVISQYSDAQSVFDDTQNLFMEGNIENLHSNLSLPAAGKEGSLITWQSSSPNILSEAGAIINRPQKGTGKVLVTLKATISKGAESSEKSFGVYVAEDEGFSAYLFAYFTGNNTWQEAIRFAVSDDGFTYKALNENNPIISSSEISSTGGVRDPHILRGENNDYYMVVTDMASANGWNSNRAMVLMKSTNLTHWEHAIINIPQTYPEFSSVDRVWAPETIYDPAVGKYMVYFSMRKGPDDYDKIYYAYANASFSGFESAPQVLFDNAGLSTIDGNIVYQNGKYHLFFKTEGNGNGIKKAVSENLTGGYVLYDKYLQPTTVAVEGGCVFRLYNTDEWLLIYDMYTSGMYQFTKSTDLENFSVVTNPVSFDFTPRHGTIIPITETEKEALQEKWGTSGIQQSASEKTPNISYSAEQKSLSISLGEIYPLSQWSLSVYNMLGMMATKKALETTTSPQQVKLPELKTGMYMVNVYANGIHVGTKKIAVK